MLVADKASQAADAQLAIDAAARGMTVEALKAETGDLGWWGAHQDGGGRRLGLRDTLQGMGVAFPYGISIFCFVLGVKLVTLPLNWHQLSGAANMKSIKPQQDLIRKWYGDNQQILNMEIGGLFENQKINPLAGCLPSLAQIPVFLGVYYSVTSIAKAQIFQEVRRDAARNSSAGARNSARTSPTPPPLVRRASSGSRTSRVRSPTAARASRGSPRAGERRAALPRGTTRCAT